MTPAQINGMSNAALDKVIIRRDQTGGYPYESLSDFIGADEHRKSWIIKGAVAWGETSAWIGPPGSLKSALMADLAIAISYNLAWHGLKSRGTCAVAYFALERPDLVRRRIEAGIARLGLDPEHSTGIFIVPSTVDLIDQRSVEKAVKTVRNIEQNGDVVGLIIFDTFAKLIAAGGGDEDKAKDQGRVFANLERFKQALGRPHVALVGHTGKDETRGARGSNAILGDVDVMVSLSGEGAIRTATVTKANDAPEGPLFSFTSAVHQFGKDEDGDPITVNVISSDPVETITSAARKATKLPPAAKLALDALDEVTSQPAPVSFGLPPGIRVAELDVWKEELRRRGVLDPEHSNPTVQFKRLWEKLAAAQQIGRRDGYVWRS